MRSPHSAHSHPVAALIVAGLLAVFVASPAGAANWPGFRGPTGQGLTDEKNLPTTWGGTNKANVAWQSPLMGEGHASPIVWGDRLFVCTARWAPGVTAREKVMPEQHLLCYAVADGKRLWDTQIPAGPWLRSDFRSGPGGGYACPTPVTDGKAVYCVFGSSVMAAVDFQGKILWHKTIEPYTFDVTIGTSPVLYQDTILFFSAMADKKDSRLAAFDKKTGEVKWLTKMPTIGFGHSTPLLIRADGRPQVLVLASAMGPAADALQSFDPVSGKRLWWCQGGGDASSPACDGKLVYFDSGRGGIGTAVDPTGSGEVTKTHIRWTVREVPEGISSPTIVDGLVYKLHTPGILKVWKASDGKQAAVVRLEGIFTTWASPVVDPRGRLFFATAGKSYVVQAGPEPKILATNDLGDGNHASPAVAGGRMFLVGMKNVYCIAEKGEKAAR